MSRRPAVSSGPMPSPPGLDSLVAPPRRRALVSLTPLIDVVFILLVFFMLASSFMDWRSISMDSPAQSRATRDESATTLVIDVRREGLRLDGSPATLDTILAAVAEGLALDPEQRVLVRPAMGVLLQEAVVVLDRLAALGVTNMALRRRVERQGGADAL